MNLAKAKTIEGWMSESELEFLAQAAAKSQLIVEFGCYHGRSTRALADNTKGIVIAVDPWERDYPDNDGNILGIPMDVWDHFKQNLADKIHDGTVIPIHKRSTEFYMASSPDFIFIDGDHRYETVKHDILLGKQLLRNGGILAGHDYGHGYWPGVKTAVDELLPKFEVIDSLWWTNV